ncbi:MAG: hypothetical protein ACTFAK_05415 [Candidatus Electronema sp. VV]
MAREAQSGVEKFFCNQRGKRMMQEILPTRFPLLFTGRSSIMTEKKDDAEAVRQRQNNQNIKGRR